jgi:hypothetical protein
VRVTVDFKEVPLAEALDQVSKVAGFPIRHEPNDSYEHPLTLTVEDLPLHEFLSLTMDLVGIYAPSFIFEREGITLAHYEMFGWPGEIFIFESPDTQWTPVPEFDELSDEEVVRSRVARARRMIHFRSRLKAIQDALGSEARFTGAMPVEIIDVPTQVCAEVSDEAHVHMKTDCTVMKVYCTDAAEKAIGRDCFAQESLDSMRTKPRKEILQSVLSQYGLGMFLSVRAGYLVFATLEEVKLHDKNVAEQRKREDEVLSRTLAGPLDEVPIHVLAGRVRNETGVDLIPDEACWKKGIKVSIEKERVSLRDIVEYLAGKHGIEFVVAVPRDWEAVYLISPEDAK